MKHQIESPIARCFKRRFCFKANNNGLAWMSNKLRCRLLASDPGTPMFVISLSGLHDRNRTELAIKLMYVGMMAEATATLTEATRNKDDVVPAMRDANASCNPLIHIRKAFFPDF